MEKEEIKNTRFKLIVAYDGTVYHGWQYQPGVATIEGELSRALQDLFAKETVIIGGSRTDAGVHALGNIAVFDAITPIPGTQIAFALNRRLPPDIRVQHSEAVADDFHPRRTASRKTYEYRIWNTALPLPTKRLYHHFTHQQLDIGLMKAGAGYLLGEHDFTSFAAAGGIADANALVNNTRIIYSVEVAAFDREIIITLTGSGFLYNMVRIIIGTLMEIGRGKYPPAEIEKIIAVRDRRFAGPTAPACGLTLIGWEFIEEERK
ncbi:MAG: tRNA pseudouridine(38-40) synthase TruA [Lachnospiraceae bacterium]|jgi:tRNA pseudouridine38-40 synthase|nr:tRNA pseudouridine(38-40) synthase TruA [Lachnospiraceae bacterium]